MNEDFKKGEFNLIQVIKLSIMAVGGLSIVGLLFWIVKLLYSIDGKL